MGQNTTADNHEPNHVVILPYPNGSSFSRPVPLSSFQTLRLGGGRNKRSSSAPSTSATTNPQSFVSRSQPSISSSCPGYKYCCCSCCPRPARTHPYVTTLFFVLLCGGFAAGLYVIFPRTDITFRITQEDYLIRQMITPTSLLPFFEIQLLNHITITNPNYVAFQLTDIVFTVYETDKGGTLSRQNTVPFLTLTTPDTLNIPGGSPQSPKENKYIVSVMISTDNTPQLSSLSAATSSTTTTNHINLASALNCARKMYGTDKVCGLVVEVSAQPVYLGLGKGIIPRQTFTFPLQIQGT